MTRQALEKWITFTSMFFLYVNLCVCVPAYIAATAMLMFSWGLDKHTNKIHIKQHATDANFLCGKSLLFKFIWYVAIAGKRVCNNA